MADNLYQSDIDLILSKRYDLGGDYFTTPDKRLSKGSPFSTIEASMLLLELGLSPADPIMQKTAEMIFDAQRDDGRFKLTPDGSIYPCHTIHAADALCRMGYANDGRLKKTFAHLLDTRHTDGGWRCKKFFFGRGPETEFSNPGPTLMALDAFRHAGYAEGEELNGAVDFLLGHWVTRKPLGPCHYGIGTLFMQVEYPFANYNLFIYTYVLSFFERARKDARFQEAFSALSEKIKDGFVVPERVNRKLTGFRFVKKGEPCDLATKRYREIAENMNG
jgi:hypothetical protein